MANQQQPLTPQFTPVDLRENFGPKSLYRYDNSTMATSHPVLRRDNNGGIAVVERLTCSRVRTLDVAGQERTNAKGKMVWRLRKRVCDSDSVIDEPVSFVATPTTEHDRFGDFQYPRPAEQVFLTVEYRLIEQERDIEVTISSWEHDGTPAGHVPFSYRALFRLLISID